MQQSSNKTLNPPSQDIGTKLPHKSKDLQRSENGSMIMNERNLKIICENQGLYEYPEMNTKIYLHFKVIEKIQNLDKYVNLKTIYLQNNVITKIQNLECLVHLQNIFLQNNMIKKMQNLQKLKELRVLNLTNNNIFKIEGISQIPHLQNLSIANNYLSEFEDLEHLGHCTSELTSIDLSGNQIKPNLQLLNLIPQVRCLYLSGNPLVRETKHYRRVIVGTLNNLLYLDQRGIDQEQRMLSEAWVEGGESAFKLAREKVHQHRQNIKQEKKKEIMKDIDVYRNRKIAMFLRNIQDFEQQIEKLRGYMNEKGNEDMTYFYESQIAQLYEKIRQNQQFVNNINKRIGAAAKSTSGGCNKSEQSVCSQDNKSEEGSKIQNSCQKRQRQKQLQNQYQNEKQGYEDEDQQMDDKKTDFPQKKSQSLQFRRQTMSLNIKKDEQSSEISFDQNKKQDNKKSIPMTPAPSSGLDQLD